MSKSPKVSVSTKVPVYNLAEGKVHLTVREFLLNRNIVNKRFQEIDGKITSELQKKRNRVSHDDLCVLISENTQMREGLQIEVCTTDQALKRFRACWPENTATQNVTGSLQQRYI